MVRKLQKIDRWTHRQESCGWKFDFLNEKNQHARSSECVLYRVDKELDVIIDKHGGGAYSTE